jgi:hypothetical protein
MKRALKTLHKLGWTRGKSSNHLKFRCPCGRHQVIVPSSSSDHRAEQNLLADIRNSGCPSVEKMEVEPDYPWPDDVTPRCTFCKCELHPSRFKKDWVYFDGVFACLSHPGVKDWAREKKKEKRAE